MQQRWVDFNVKQWKTFYVQCLKRRLRAMSEKYVLAGILRMSRNVGVTAHISSNKLRNIDN